MAVDLWRPYYGMSVVIPMGPRDYTVFVREPNRANSMWKFAGGKIEEGESEVVAALRELGEETGIVLSAMDLYHLDTRYKERRNYHIHYFATLLDNFDGVEPVAKTGEITLLYPLNRILTNVDWDLLQGFDILPDHLEFLRTFEPKTKTYGRRYEIPTGEMQHV